MNCLVRCMVLPCPIRRLYYVFEPVWPKSHSIRCDLGVWAQIISITYWHWFALQLRQSWCQKVFSVLYKTKNKINKNGIPEYREWEFNLFSPQDFGKVWLFSVDPGLPNARDHIICRLSFLIQWIGSDCQKRNEWKAIKQKYAELFLAELYVDWMATRASTIV